MSAEISYDPLMTDAMAFVEGAYRLPGGHWQVFIFSRSPVSHPEIDSRTWESDVAGVFVRYPQSQKLNKAAVEAVLSQHTAAVSWREVAGPDSMELR